MHIKFTYVVLHLSVVFVHELKKPQLDLGLVQEGFLVLDDLDGHPLLLVVVIGFHHLHVHKQKHQIGNGTMFVV